MRTLWTPSGAAVAGAQMTAFREEVERRHGERLEDSAALHAWSIREPGAFWRALWDFCGVVGDPGARAVVDLDQMPGARWFPDAELSFAENLLRRRDDAPAIVLADERGTARTLSFGALYDEVSRATEALRGLGVGEGDRVAGYVPNIPEAIVFMLASSALGAIWSSSSPDFGVPGLLDRFGQITPKVFVTVDGYRYGGKRFDLRPKVRDALAGLPSVEHAIVVGYLDEAPDLGGLVPRGPRAPALHLCAELLAAHAPRDIAFARLPFDYPLYVLYSSGTTGKPKCIVHGQGGTLLQHLKEHRLHTDLRADERLFYFTTCGWMMWNWLVSGLASGACLVLYDGHPMSPAPSVLFDLIDREQVHVFGTSAKFLDAIAKRGLRPMDTHDLGTTRAILSTGSPLVPESFDFVYEHVKRDVQLASISGGTDIVSCFVLGDPTRPVRRGEIQAKGLGMDVQVWNDAGERVIGERGELVCAKPFPSMPVRFWGDEGGERYRSAYFERFPGVWCHGDFTEETPDGGFIITGRSDAVLNPGGVRIGTAEIYREVEQLDEVLESVVIGQPSGGDVRVVLFVVLREGAALDDALRERIRARLRTHASPRHVPHEILGVPAIPRTRSGKISELSVRRAVLGEPIPNVDALANPEALDAFRDRPELADA